MGLNNLYNWYQSLVTRDLGSTRCFGVASMKEKSDSLVTRKRIRDSDFVTDLEVSSEEGYVPYTPREIGLGVNVEDSYEPYTKPDIDPDVQADIDACITFANDIKARGTDVRVTIGTVAEEEAESSARGTIEIGVDRVTHPVISDDITMPVREHFPELVRVDRSLDVMHRGLEVVMQELYDHMVEILVHRVRVIKSVQRYQGHRIVATSQHSAAMSERIVTLEWDNKRLKCMLDVERQRVECLRRSMLTMLTATRSRMTQDAINELIVKCVEEALKVYDAARNPETETEMENDQQEDNVEANGDNGNGNRNGNGNPNVNNRGVVPVARECTYQDFVKCQPLNFKGTEGVVGLTRWFEKMETVFHINNCPSRYQVKYASCTLLDGALTWSNSNKRTVGVDVAYAMTWKALMKLMTEEDQVEKHIVGLSDNIQGNVIVDKPVRLQYAICIANNLIDQELKGYAIKNAENKRRIDNNSRDNRGQQQPFKRQNNNGQNVARACTVRNNVERRGYARALPYYNKCRMHHEGPCTVKCGNCKRVGHITRDCKAAVAATTQRDPNGNQTGNTFYEYGRQGHYRNECPKLRNQNRGNKTGNKTGNNEAKARAYAIRGGGANLDSNIVTGMFLLNNHYATMLFDLGVDRSYVLTTFSALLDVMPSTLDTSYVIELVDGRISKTNMILRVCTLGLLGHPFDIDPMPIELSSFDVIFGMDWLEKYHAVIVCDEKIVHIPYGDEMLIIECDGCNGGITAKKTDDKSEEKRLEDVPFVRDFLEIKKEHEGHLKLVLGLLKEEKLFAKFSKCEFWLSKVKFLGHVIDSEGIHVDPANIESLKDWASPKTPTEIR
ncbi:putative reverse transcriptase domain-containing protein [Tanacetum coccineum]